MSGVVDWGFHGSFILYLCTGCGDATTHVCGHGVPSLCEAWKHWRSQRSMWTPGPSACFARCLVCRQQPQPRDTEVTASSHQHTQLPWLQEARLCSGGVVLILTNCQQIPLSPASSTTLPLSVPVTDWTFKYQRVETKHV